MKHLTALFLISVITFFYQTCFALSQSSDTTYLNTTHVMTAQGQIIANTVTNRKNYMDKGSKVMEERVVTNMSYPEPDGSTHVNVSTEELTVVDGTMKFFKGVYTENDSTTVIMGEKDGNNFVVSGKTHGESSFQIWDQRNLKDIDAFVVYFDIDKLQLSKVTQVKRMYDLYSIELRKNKLSKLGSENLELVGQNFNCTMVKFNYGVIKGKVWFSKDNAGNAFLVKEEAQSQQYGPFDLDMTDYNTLKPSSKKAKKDDFGF
jgi:hypothetical protein